jgi:hypothetical protein
MRVQLGRRLTDHELRALVASALLHLHDPAWLSMNSPLVELAEVQRRSAGSSKLFADGHALAELLHHIAQGISARLEGDGKLATLRAIYAGICDGRSIAAIARDQGKTREHFSRTYWRLAVQLLTAELAAMDAQRRVAYNGGRERKPTT